MSENKRLYADRAAPSREEALNIGILSVIHNFTKLNIGSILGGISQMEFLTLYMINRHGEPHDGEERCIHVSAIANILKISSPAASRLIKGLVEKELAVRITDNNDRRNTYVYLTESGKELLESDEHKVREFSVKVAERIGRGKLARLCVLTAELGGAVEEELAQYSHSRI